LQLRAVISGPVILEDRELPPGNQSAIQCVIQCAENGTQCEYCTQKGSTDLDIFESVVLKGDLHSDDSDTLSLAVETDHEIQRFLR
jgi:hypothetical protein